MARRSIGARVPRGAPHSHGTRRGTLHRADTRGYHRKRHREMQSVPFPNLYTHTLSPANPQRYLAAPRMPHRFWATLRCIIFSEAVCWQRCFRKERVGTCAPCTNGRHRLNVCFIIHTRQRLRVRRHWLRVRGEPPLVAITHCLSHKYLHHHGNPHSVFAYARRICSMDQMYPA